MSMVKVDFEKIVNYRSKVGLNPVQSGSSIPMSVDSPKIIHIDSPTPDSMCVDSPNYTTSNYLLNESASKRQLYSTVLFDQKTQKL